MAAYYFAGGQAIELSCSSSATGQTDCPSYDEYVALPTLQSTDEVFYHLIDVNDQPNGTQFSITPKADVLVDLGDGTSQTVTANTLFTYVFDYNNSALDGTEISTGSKQAIVTVTPVTPGTLTEIEYMSGDVPNSVKKLSLAGPAVNALTLVNLPRVEQLTIKYTPSLTTLATFAKYARQLKLFDIDFSNVTNCLAAFRESGLRGRVTCSAPTATTVNSLFYRVYSTDSIVLSAPQATNAVACFRENKSAFSIEADLSSSTNNNSLFQGCVSLQRVLLKTAANFDVSQTAMNADGINEMFAYLTDVSGSGGATVTVPAGKGQDNSIATALGWTVVEA